MSRALFAGLAIWLGLVVVGIALAAAAVAH